MVKVTMKVSIIHGDNNFVSRSHLQKNLGIAKGKGWSIVRLGNSQLKISEELSNLSLFEDKTLYFLDGGEKLTPAELTWFKENADHHQSFLLIYSPKQLPPTFFKNFPKEAKIERFDIPQKIFTLLESFYPGNGKVFLNLLQQVSATEPIEFIFSLLAKQIRDLYWVLTDAKTLIYPPWRLAKIQKQAQKFTPEDLQKIIETLSRDDIAAKTSKVNLLDSLGLLIIKTL